MNFVMTSPLISVYLRQADSLRVACLTQWLHFNLLGYSENEVFAKLEGFLSARVKDDREFEDSCDILTDIMATLQIPYDFHRGDYITRCNSVVNSGLMPEPKISLIDSDAILLTITGVKYEPGNKAP